jgi:hypothetical protein
LFPLRSVHRPSCLLLHTVAVPCGIFPKPFHPIPFPFCAFHLAGCTLLSLLRVPVDGAIPFPLRPFDFPGCLICYPIALPVGARQLPGFLFLCAVTIPNRSRPFRGRFRPVAGSLLPVLPRQLPRFLAVDRLLFRKTREGERRQTDK